DGAVDTGHAPIQRGRYFGEQFPHTILQWVRQCPTLEFVRHSLTYDNFSPSGTIGIQRSRTPVAARMALPTAGAMPMIGVSPAPADGRSLRSTSTTSCTGASLNRGSRYSENFGLRILPSAKSIPSNSPPPPPPVTAPPT